MLLRRAVRQVGVTPFKELQAVVAARSRIDAAPTPEVAPVLAVRVGDAVSAASRFVPEARCVAQSLVAQTMLARRGVPSTIQFGFRRKADGEVEGHAWTEACGQIVAGDGDLTGFTRTAVFEA